MHSPSISAIIIVKNEEMRLRACLDTLRWVDEILVVDSGSTDRTIEIAQEYATRVIQTEWLGYAETKTLAMRETTCEWILWVDADERIPSPLAAELRAAAEHAEYDGFYIARKAIFLGRWIRHCGWYPGYVCRFFRKDRARFTDTLVHESVIIDGRIGYLAEAMIHETDPSLEHYLEKFNTYTSLAAEQLYRDHRPFRPFDLIFRPPFAFVKMYVIRLGFLDGIQGFILCVLSACYVFTKYAKLWHLMRSSSKFQVPGSRL